MESEPPYQYVGGNPVNLADPSGTNPFCIPLIIVDGPLPVGDGVCVVLIGATLWAGYIGTTGPIAPPDISLPEPNPTYPPGPVPAPAPAPPETKTGTGENPFTLPPIYQAPKPVPGPAPVPSPMPIPIPPPFPPATCTPDDGDARVEIYSSGINPAWVYGVFSAARHLFIVHSDQRNNKHVIEGFPDGKWDTPQGVRVRVQIKALTEPGLSAYLREKRNNARSLNHGPRLIASGEEARSALQCFDAVGRDIFNSGVRYYSFPSKNPDPWLNRVKQYASGNGANSNSAAYTLLQQCKLPTLRPFFSGGNTPGWGINIITDNLETIYDPR